MTSSMEYNGVIMHFNRILEYSSNNSVSKAILLSHPLYFLQNGYDKVISVDLDEPENERVDIITAGKVLLLLHSIPFNYGGNNIKSFFNSKNNNNVGYEMVPYGYLALAGGILYRRRILESTGKDIVNVGTIYKNPGKDGIFLVNDGGKTQFGIIKKDSTKEYQSYKVVISDNIDLYVENKLIELFISFANEVSSLLDSIEIKRVMNDAQQGNRNVPFTYSVYTSFVSQMNSKNINDINKVLKGDDTFIINGVNNTITGFSDNYSIGFIHEAKLLLYYREDYIRLQSIFDKLYNHKTGVLTLVSQNTPDRSGAIKTSCYNNILNSFASTLLELCKTNKTETENESTKDLSTSKNAADEDLKKSIYLYMKQFWDKWLCGVYNDITDGISNKDIPFTVEWFKKQFLFIDTFYNDVSCTLKLNCSILLELYETSINSESPSGVHVYNHLANVAERHFCNFFCYPDFIHFAKHDSNGCQETPEKILSDIFKPIPYNQINPVEVENQFVIIRNSSAQINGDTSQFTNDGFDIWTSDSGTAIAPATFKNINKGYNEDNHELRMAYKVPAFGVAFSRQNNSLFKTIDVGMDTVQVTEQSIKSMAYISQQGNSNKHAITFYGNDIYGVYSAYSYFVTITMMGDAQIQPLMYFQLMNIPMFRGTYMVIEVKHSIRAGEFTTTFRGMKMSRIEQPTNTSWFTVEPEGSEGNDSNNGDNCEGGQVDSNGTPISSVPGSGKESSSNAGNIKTYMYEFNPKNFRLANKFCDSNVGIPYGPNHKKIPTPDECQDIKLICVGASFVSEYGTGTVEGITVVNGKVMGTLDGRSYNGGFVVYKNGTAKLCPTNSDFKAEVDTGHVLWGFQNILFVRNGVGSDIVSGSHIYQCIAEFQDGRFAFITTTKEYPFSSFKDYVLSLNVKNAIYLDTNGFACYGWTKTSLKQINGDSSKIKDGVFYWGGYTSHNATSTIIYIV